MPDHAASRSFSILPTDIPGCFIIHPMEYHDRRGSFIKTFHRDAFHRLGLASDFPEQFCTFSRPGVLRGLHFQVPPKAHAKLVTCLMGEVLDVLVDLRTDSPCCGQPVSFHINAEQPSMLYIPAGVAHGFYALRESCMFYWTTTQHSPPHDAGIRWDSIGFRWPNPQPIVSERDSALPALHEFRSPFRMED